MNNKRLLFDFDDILIIPATSTNINSRYTDIKLPNKLPLFTAPMDTVVDLTNYKEFIKNNINVVLPRTVSLNDVFDGNYYYGEFFISLGFNDIEYHIGYNFKLIPYHARILIDVANGHQQKIIKYCRFIKMNRPDIIIMVGNIANPETYKLYAQSGYVEYIRIGIGNGGGCLTTKNSGVGYPMASLIHDVYQVKQTFIKNNPQKKVPFIVADGGMKDYADIVKALALGADYVMVGSIFNKALESCSTNHIYGLKINKKIANYLFNRKLPIKKYFRGMSTKEAQKAMGKTVFTTSEGVTRFRRVEYHLSGWIENFEHYLRNAMSYSDSKTLDEFIGNTNILQITRNAYDRFNK